MKTIRSLLLPAVFLAAGGCSTPSDPLGVAGGNGILFLALPTQPNAVMDALFEGRIRTDEAGCLRLDRPHHFPEAHTVIWPFGSTLGRDGSALVVRDADGQVIARIGSPVRFGGGEVPDVDHAVAAGAVAPERVPAVRARCPGRFWIVGDTG